MSASVIVVEDSDPIRLAIETALASHGYDVTERRDGTGLEELLDAVRPAVVVLDIMLPGRSGLELLEVVRARTDAAVLLLTARDTAEDRVHGLRSGADDYLVKPFVMAELAARIEALLRRTGAPPPAAVVGDLQVADDGASVTRAGQRIELTETERRVLMHLLRRRGQTVSKTQLLTGVWGYDGFDPNIVEVHVSSLRRKLEAHGDRIVHTVRGRGYRLGDE